MELVSDRRYSFHVDVDELWTALADVDRFPRVWPWMRHFDARGLTAGDTWSCIVRPPLPYSVRVVIALQQVVDRSHVSATIGGDIVGSARIDLEPTQDGSAIRLRCSLAPSGRMLGMLAIVLRPVVSRGHDWVLDTGAAQFAAGLSTSPNG